jgi:flagellar hook-associated protein 3 FlgL
MFAGYQTDTAPFTRAADFTPGVYHGDDGSFQIPIADNVKVSVDTDGRNYFQDAVNGGVNIFDQLRDLINGLESADTTQIQATVDPLEAAHVQITNKRSEGAPKLYRLDISEQYWTHFKPKIQEVMGRDEDADITRVAVELNNLRTAYETSMAAAAKILQRGLVDFLG